MLTSSNQYLRPEYLTPLPTTLDAKKSPLALLAQTCSQIGADSPNSKLLQSADKSSKKSDPSKDKDKSSSAPSNYNIKNHLDSTREKSRSPDERSSSTASANRVRTPSSTGSSLKGAQVNGRCNSNQSATSARESPMDRKTPAEDSNRSSKSPEKASEGSNSPQTPSGSKTAFTPNILTSSSDPAIKDLPLGTFKPGMPPVSSAFLTTSSYPGFPPGLPMDLMTSSLISRTSALSPYFSYGRLKTQDSLSACRDPYCTGCSMSSHLLGAQKPPCPAGCTQCDHAKVPTSLPSGYSHAAAAYAHAQLAALAAASHLPYVCNWISGDAAYCGKRFSSSEELLAHLRTHTSATSEASALLGPPTHPLLHRTYPTPPLSPLATARYHPYSKPPLLPPSLSGFPIGHPALPPYLNPYSIYGPRLGSTPGMHP
ncbi:zinc finger protein Elbow-like [Anthonomus grandis grandis]|uniref:zinc finger protein Elbow-like n=1 Tax=Anthonomus grandis grandis TaxID=2921223 RepID=UPI002165C51E|nr:zinc finger protein Elbow-like [Anthonomus grandis grandis]